MVMHCKPFFISILLFSNFDVNICFHKAIRKHVVDILWSRTTKLKSVLTAVLIVLTTLGLVQMNMSNQRIKAQIWFKCFCELSHKNSKSIIHTSSKNNFSLCRLSESFSTAVDEPKNMWTDLNVYFMIKSNAVINQIFDKRSVNNTSLNNISFRFRFLVLTNVFHLLPNLGSEMFSLTFPCNTCQFLVVQRKNHT